MFLYIYVDYFALYKPGVIDDILAGVVWEFDISQTLLTAFLTSVAIPILMVMLSMTLPARVNRADIHKGTVLHYASPETVRGDHIKDRKTKQDREQT